MSAYDGHEEGAGGWDGCGEGLGFSELAGAAAESRGRGAMEAVGQG